MNLTRQIETIGNRQYAIDNSPVMICLLLIAYCLLPIAYCLLPIDYIQEIFKIVAATTPAVSALSLVLPNETDMK
jgi:hypothetical protein